jgi:capsular polysaccharide biosynthesis protein
VTIQVSDDLAVADQEQAAATAAGTSLPSDEAFATLHFVRRELRRRRRLWLLTAVLGLCAGLAFSVFLPKQDSATTTLLLLHTPGEDPGPAMDTDLSLLTTRAVADDAVTSLGPPLTSSQLLQDYRGAKLSNEVMRITAKGSTPVEATRRADAVGSAFLGFRRQRYERLLTIAVKALQDRTSQLQAEAAAITSRINSLPSGGGVGGSSLSDLITSRTSLISEISKLDQEVQSNSLTTTTVVDGTSVVDRARPVQQHKAKTVGTNVLVGLIGGWALGAGWVAFTAVASDSVRSREDVMLALDAPVGLSMGTASWRRRLRKYRRWRHPDRSTREIERAQLYLGQVISSGRPSQLPNGTGTAQSVAQPTWLPAAIATGQSAGHDQTGGHFRTTSPSRPPGSGSLAVVSLKATALCWLVTTRLAVDLAVAGARAVVVNLTGDVAPAGRTIRQPKPMSDEDRNGGAVRVVTPPRDVLLARETAWPWLDWFTQERGDATVADLREWADISLVVAVLDPAVGMGPLSEWATTAVVVYTAGSSTGAQMRSTAELLRSGDVYLDSAIVVGADRTDESTGQKATGWPMPHRAAGRLNGSARIVVDP